MTSAPRGLQKHASPKTDYVSSDGITLFHDSSSPRGETREMYVGQNVTLYINGDSNFFGKKLLVNRSQMRTWDAFLNAAVKTTGESMAIREIATPEHGTRIRNLSDLQDKGSYVTITKGTFKPIGYTSLGSRYKQKITRNRRNLADILKIKPVEHSNIQRPAKVFLDPLPSISILVFANGNEFDAHRIPIDVCELCDYELVLLKVTSKVTGVIGSTRAPCCGYVVGRLYTTEGRKITDPRHLINAGIYVAVGSEPGGFQRLPYGCTHVPHTSPYYRRVPFVQRRVSCYQKYDSIFVSPPRQVHRKNCNNDATRGVMATRYGTVANDIPLPLPPLPPIVTQSYLERSLSESPREEGSRDTNDSTDLPSNLPLAADNDNRMDFDRGGNFNDLPDVYLAAAVSNTSSSSYEGGRDLHVVHPSLATFVSGASTSCNDEDAEQVEEADCSSVITGKISGASTSCSDEDSE